MILNAFRNFRIKTFCFNSEANIRNKTVYVFVIKVHRDFIVKSNVHGYVAAELMLSTQTIHTRVAN
jgi:hypothetical protein